METATRKVISSTQTINRSFAMQAKAKPLEPAHKHACQKGEGCVILGFRCLVSLRFGVYVFPNMTGRRSRLARALSFERACYIYVRYDCLMFEN